LKDLSSLKTYIVDSKNPKEIDDAVSLEINNNVKLIWIHISYPTRLFKYNSEIDNEAKHKASSLYLIDKYISMLPENIIKKSNLKQNKSSETLSACIELNENGSIKRYEVLETIIKPNYEFTYDDVNEILELEPPEEKELISLNKLLKKSFNYRKEQGALSFNNTYTKILLNNNIISFEKIDVTEAHNLVSEAMILMGFVISDYLLKNNIPAPYRSQKINCDSKNILERNYNSPIKYIILKQFIGRSITSTKSNIHETLGLKSYVQSTSPLRRYLDLLVQRQINLYINKQTILSEEIINNEIELNKIRNKENNNIIKEDRLFYLRLYFNKNDKNNLYKIIFIRWINHKKNIAMVYFTDISIELLIYLYISVNTYPNKIYKVKYSDNNNSNLLEFIN
tara:strand:- start:266 stop:1453 length:1188 start_codon:yes stop_codon:yes gene_type:complete